MKRSAFLRRGAAGAVALTVGAKSIPAEADPVVEWNRPLVQVFPDGTHRVLWWPGKDEIDAAITGERTARIPE